MSDAKAFRERNRKVVTLPSGLDVTVQKLTGLFLFDIRELFEQMLAAGEREAQLRLSAAQQREYIERVVCAAVVSPRVVPQDQPASDDVLHVADFGLDLDPLVRAIQDYNPEILVQPFRPAADESVAAPASGDLRDPAEPVAPGHAE